MTPFVPNKAFQRPSGNAGTSGFVAGLLNIIGAKGRAQSELAMHEAKHRISADIDTDAYAKRRAIDTASTVGDEERHASRHTELMNIQRKAYEDAGFHWAPHDIYNLQATPLGQVANELRLPKDEGTSASQTQSKLFTHTKDLSTPGNWQDVHEAVKAELMSHEEGMAISPEYAKRLRNENSKLTQDQFETEIMRRSTEFAERNPLNKPTPKPAPTPKPEPDNETGQI